jgi:hypothetical protein
MGMGSSGIRFPIERRRLKPPELSNQTFHYNQPQTRRETDLVRMRIQHWMELADTALRSRKPSSHRRTPGFRTTHSAALPQTGQLGAAVKRGRQSVA